MEGCAVEVRVCCGRVCSGREGVLWEGGCAVEVRVCCGSEGVLWKGGCAVEVRVCCGSEGVLWEGGCAVGGCARSGMCILVGGCK